MFRRVLVPLDGSTRAEQALPVAARLAQASGGTVVLLRVVSPLSEPLPNHPTDPELRQAMVAAEVAAAKSYLDRITQMGILTGIPTETSVIFGQAAATILSNVDARRIDLVVLCSHGYTGMQRWVIGSVAEKVVRHAPVPVLVLREGEGLLAGPVAEFKLAISWSVTIDDDIAAGIIRVAENGEDAGEGGRGGVSDVIAMATHGFGGLQRWAVGSVTERVLHATRLPLLIVRPPDMVDQSPLFRDKTGSTEIQKGDVE